MDNETTKLMDKTADELTVADTLKVTVVTTVVATAAMIAIPMALGVGVAAKDKFRAVIRARKAAKTETTPDMVEEN